MEEKRICFECGCVIPDGEDIWVAGARDYICEDCYNDDYVTCDDCGDVTRVDDSVYIDDTVYCEYCYRDNYTSCACCGEVVHNDNARETVDGDVCDRCYWDNYRECCECGDVIHVDSGYYDEYDDCWYCADCEPKMRAIREYGYKPEPVFNGNSDMYIGVELEIDGAGHSHENAQRLIDINSLVYCKTDGSLNDGFEIVSHPCDLDYHINDMRWDELLTECKNMGYTSHDAETCGLHIHVSRKALGDDDVRQEKTISNILYFVENNWDKMLKFSRRTQTQLNRWADRYGLEPDETPTDLYCKARKQYKRYTAVNLLNHNTIEFRLFRGTLNYTTFVATLQLVHHICEMCKMLELEDITDVNWGDFVASVEDRQYSELLEYLQIRGIKEIL